MHILCYLPQKPERLQGLCTRTLKNRTQAGEEMIRRVMRYFPVTAEHIARYTSGSQSIYKAHIMLALMDLGYTDRIYSDLYHQLFSSKDGSCYVPFEYPDAREVAETIHQAGGVAVMAHPFQYGGSYELLEELAEKGMIDGVECHHPRGTAEQNEHSAQIARHFGLIRTGGTDFHGARTSNPNPIGTCITTEENITALYGLVKK